MTNLRLNNNDFIIYIYPYLTYSICKFSTLKHDIRYNIKIVFSINAIMERHIFEYE